MRLVLLEGIFLLVPPDALAVREEARGEGVGIVDGEEDLDVIVAVVVAVVTATEESTRVAEDLAALVIAASSLGLGLINFFFIWINFFSMSSLS